jgi:acyl-CoA reductase-like NAD-dependent aldehyde dehydrogenase
MTDQSFQRQQDLLGKAEEGGKVVYKGESDASTRRMGFSLVKLAEDGQGEEGALVQEEIFGAVLPIIPVSVRFPFIFDTKRSAACISVAIRRPSCG